MCFCFDKELDRQQYIHTKGCVGQFEKWLQDNLIIVAGIFVGIALLQVSSPCLNLIELGNIYMSKCSAFECICLLKTNEVDGLWFCVITAI